MWVPMLWWTHDVVGSISEDDFEHYEARGAICRGGGPGIHTVFWFRRSCSSRRRWSAYEPFMKNSLKGFPVLPHWHMRKKAMCSASGKGLVITAAPLRYGDWRNRCENYGGELPRERDVLESFPGIGPYTAGAVRAFALERSRCFYRDEHPACFHPFLFPETQKGP